MTAVDFRRQMYIYSFMQYNAKKVKYSPLKLIHEKTDTNHQR